MNRSLLFLFLAFSGSVPALAQDIVLVNQVVASAGRSAVLSGRHWTYTVGEPIIMTLTGSSHVLTQGFNQPEFARVVSTTELDLDAWQLAVFPNPTTDFLTVRYAADRNSGLIATVFDLLGKIVYMPRELPLAQGSEIDCSAWLPGVYLLQLQDPASGATATVRFIRL